MTRTVPMFRKLLYASDGSEHAFHPLSMAFAIAKQNASELHMVCVEEIDYTPKFIKEGSGGSQPFGSL
jgi:hypothetical protein